MATVVRPGEPAGDALAHGAYGACAVAWAPDGDSILYERGTCGEVTDVAEVRVIGVDGSGDRAIWSGDARATGRLSLGWQPIP